MEKIKRKLAATDISPKFLCLFVCCCAYAFFRAKAAFDIAPGLFFRLFLPFLLLGVLLPITVHSTLRRGGRSWAARLAFWAGYSWMGFTLLFFFTLTSVDLAALLLGTGSALAGSIPELGYASQQNRFLISLFLSLVLWAYALYEAFLPRVKRVVIETEKLPPAMDSLRLTQVSDIHMGPVVGKKRAERIAGIVRGTRPDILLSTGDFIDARAEYLQGMEEIFGKLSVPMGKYAVIGNHEVSAGLEGALTFLEKSGFRVLRNETAAPGEAICIVGADDESAAGNEKNGRGDSRPLENTRTGLFTLYLKHRPPKDGAGDNVVFDLQLSGHTHGGQLFPYRYVTMGHYPKLKGLYQLEGNKLLYVSAGAGTWGPPIRFLTPPEVTVIDLIRPASRGT
jgi:predicted MPP superfamily phosphohydrolase